MIIDILSSAIRIGTPLGWAALGETFSQRAGVANVQLEGMMLTGAFTGVLAARYSESALIGLLAAMGGGLFIAMIQGLVCIKLPGDQIVSGIGLNLLALGGTGFLLRVFFREYSLAANASVSAIRVPFLADIPVVGQVFFQQSILVYCLYGAVPLSAFVLYRSSWGLKVIASGENPHAADSAGVDVSRVRWQALLLSGACAGLGGGVLALTTLRAFVGDMIQGRGYIALAAVLFGNWRPGYAIVGVSLFSLADAAQVRLQAVGVGIPPQLMTMLPFVLTVLALAGVVGRSRQPAYFARPYVRGKV